MMEGYNMLMNIADHDFEKIVLAGCRPVLVDFWANWCAPCRMLTPALADLAIEYADSIDIVKVDIEAFVDIASRFDVKSLPLLVLFHNGNEVARQVGFVSRTRLAAFIEDNIEKIR
jgi:thioredoxin 1